MCLVTLWSIGVKVISEVKGETLWVYQKFIACLPSLPAPSYPSVYVWWRLLEGLSGSW